MTSLLIAQSLANFNVDTLIWLIVKLAIIGFIVYVIITYIPMNDLFKKLIIAVIAIAVCLYLLTLIP